MGAFSDAMFDDRIIRIRVEKCPYKPLAIIALPVTAGRVWTCVRKRFGSCGFAHLTPSVWRRDWVVHCQSAGDGRQSLRYLAPYVFRVAIGDHRIVACDDGRVTFTYRKVGSNRRRTMTQEATDFLRRFLEHVLPSGFQKVRYYGFLGPAAAVAPESVRWLIAVWAGLTYVLRCARTRRHRPRPAGRDARRAAAGWCGWAWCRRRARRPSTRARTMISASHGLRRWTDPRRCRGPVVVRVGAGIRPSGGAPRAARGVRRPAPDLLPNDPGPGARPSRGRSRAL